MEVFPLERLTKLYDGMDHMDEPWDEEGSYTGSEYSEEEDITMLEIAGEDGAWQRATTDEGDWEDVEEEEDVFSDSVDDSRDWAMDSKDSAPEEPALSTPVKDSGSATPQPPTDNTKAGPDSASNVSEPAGTPTGATEQPKEELPWERFEILSEAPADHAFFTHKPAQPSKNFMSRLTKEYRALTTSLPGTLFASFCTNFGRPV